MNAFYLINLLVYAAVDAMACLGLSQQFGVAGVTNFGFIIFQAAGGYTAAVLSLPHDSANGGFQSYMGGLNLPFPLPWIGAAVVGALIAVPFTFLVGRRLRGDFAAVGLLVTAVLLNLLVTNYRPLLNGDAGLSLIPTPLHGDNVFSVQSAGYQWAFAVLAIVLALAVYRFVRRITESPYGRSLRAMRDNDVVADSLGKNLLWLRTVMLVTGGAIAGLSGGILVTYVTTWSPAAWGYAETVVLFAAVIIGGAGNHLGAILGAILVPVGFEEITRFIPTSNNLPPNLIPSLQWVAIGLLIVIFLWVRPQGILPERKRVIRLPGSCGGRRGRRRWAGRTRACGPMRRLRPKGTPAVRQMVTVVASTPAFRPAHRRLAPRTRSARFHRRPARRHLAAPTARLRLRGRLRFARLWARLRRHPRVRLRRHRQRRPRPRASGAASPSARLGPGSASDVVIEAVDVVREFGGVRAVAGCLVPGAAGDADRADRAERGREIDAAGHAGRDAGGDVGKDHL